MKCQPAVLMGYALAFSLLLLMPQAFAAFTVSVSTPTKSLTENEQTTVTVTVTNPGTSTESNVVVQLSGSPTSWFGSSLVQDCTVISSIASSQSQTSTCILRQTTVGTDLTLTATAESSGGTTGSGSTGGISVSSTSGSITASVTGASSVSLSESFYVSVAVTAPASTDATNVRATISVSGACTLITSAVPADQTLGTISKGTTKSPLNWQLMGSSSAGTCTVTVNVASDNLGNANPTKSISVGTVSSESGTGSSTTAAAGAGGAAGATTPKVPIPDTTDTKNGQGNLPRADVTAEAPGKIRFVIPQLPAGTTSLKSIADSDLLEQVGVVDILLTLRDSQQNANVNVEKLSSKPSDVPKPSGSVYRYLKIETSIAPSSLSEAKVQFMIVKSWLEANGAQADAVMLKRYADGKWTVLPTNRIREDDVSLVYEATTPGFSYFAITATGKTTGLSAIFPLWRVVLLLVAAAAIVVWYLLFRKTSKAYTGHL